jgi:TetR/AcrR family transcriptional regulator, transcriptional repressor for nem operon
MPKDASKDLSKDSKLNKQDTRLALINAGTNIILEKGFNHTGIEQVLKAVGVPKGSFYYYFKSKEDFGLQLIQHHADLLMSDLKKKFQDESVTPFQRIRQYFECGRDSIKQNECRKGCLFGNLSQEMADQNETFRLELADIFCKWCKILSACIQQAQEQGEIPAHMNPDRLAEYMMFSWEGAILRCKLSKSLQPIDTHLHFIFEELLKV